MYNEHWKLNLWMMKKGPTKSSETGGLIGLIHFFANRPLLTALLSFGAVGGLLTAEMRLLAEGDDRVNKGVVGNIDDVRDYVSEHLLEGGRMEVVDEPRHFEARGKINGRGFRCFLDADGNPTSCSTTMIFRDQRIHSVSGTQGGGVVACSPESGSEDCLSSRDGTYPGFGWVKEGLSTEAEVRKHAGVVMGDLITQIRAKVTEGEADSVDSLD